MRRKRGYEWVISHIYTCPDESWHTYEWVMSHIWMSAGSRMNESRHTKQAACLECMRRKRRYEWVMPHMQIYNESQHTYEWVTAHVWIRHGTRMNTSRYTYEWVMSHMTGSIPRVHVLQHPQPNLQPPPALKVSHQICVMWLILLCAVTPSQSQIQFHPNPYSNNLMHPRSATLCVMWLVLFVCHDSFSVPNPLSLQPLLQQPPAPKVPCYAWRDSFFCVPWLILNPKSTFTQTPTPTASFTKGMLPCCMWHDSLSVT